MAKCSSDLKVITLYSAAIVECHDLDTAHPDLSH